MSQNYGTGKYYFQLVGVITASVLLILLSILSSIIWLPLLIINIPVIIIVVVLFKYTSLRDKYQYKIQDFFGQIISKSSKLKKFLWVFIYDSIQVFYPQEYWRIINYGYAILNQEGKLLKNLKPEYEEERFGIQLYHFIASKFNKLKDLKGLNIVEISSGRGGGLEYIQSNLHANRCTGIDLAQNQINFCHQQYKNNKNMSFYKGDAENLDKIPQISENLYDIGINIESLHCYAEIEKFLDSASYIIKDNGNLIVADFKTPKEWEKFNEVLKSNKNWILEEEEDITLNVSQALKLDDAKRQEMMKNNINQMIQKLLQKMFSFEGGRIQKDLSERKTLYKAFILKNNKKQE